MVGISYPDVSDMDTDEMSHLEARIVICREVGLNITPYSTFGKADLNSIYRYFTGEFFFPKDDYYTSDSPPTGEIRLGIAKEAGLDYDPGPQFNRPFDLEDTRRLAETVRTEKDRRHD